MSAAALQIERRSAARALIGDYMVLSKARIVMMVLITTAAGYWVGGARFDAVLFVHLMIGTALVAGGTNALNQVWERDLDARMVRTRRRPLPSGRLSPRHALIFSIAISITGIAWLALAVSPLASLLSFATLASYLFIYTPLKTRTTLCTVIGAAPGAVPPMIGYAAATGLLDATVVGALRVPLRMAASALPRAELDVPRRLRPRRLSDAIGRRPDGSGRGAARVRVEPRPARGEPRPVLARRRRGRLSRGSPSLPEAPSS